MLLIDQILDHFQRGGEARQTEAKRDSLGVNVVEELLSYMRQAEVFDFGDIPCEPSPRKGVFVAPELTDDEFEFWHEGLIPLPAPVCWYEFHINGIPSGMIITTIDGMIVSQRVDFTASTKTKAAECVVDGIWTHLKPGRFSLLYSRFPMVKAFIQKLMQDDREFVEINYAVNPQLTVYMSLMLNSQTTEVRQWNPEASVNRLRRLRNKLPLKSHTIVTIVPKRFIIEGREKGESTGNHKRLHWRRSHTRTMHRGQANEFKIVIPRFLVGKRELGEITHEYRVRTNANPEAQRSAPNDRARAREGKEARRQKEGAGGPRSRA
jgi:hypothetical protein